MPEPDDRTAWRSASWWPLLLGLALGLLAAGCGARPYEEIHSTRVYHHHLEGTEVATHTRHF